MNTGKMLFAQLMDFLPWTTFARYVARYGGDKGVRTLSCAEQFRVMAFAQLAYRESLRDIETCLSAQAAKLCHMGFREPVRRSTLADANESRDWRIWADFAQQYCSDKMMSAKMCSGSCLWGRTSRPRGVSLTLRNIPGAVYERLKAVAE